MTVLDIKDAVRCRDGYRCVDCGLLQPVHRKTLDVHRVIPGSVYTLEGSVTLCRKCHKIRHGKIKRSGKHRPPRYPSREKTRYVGISLELHQALQRYADSRSDEDDQKSVNWTARRAIRKFLTEEGFLPPPPT